MKLIPKENLLFISNFTPEELKLNLLNDWANEYKILINENNTEIKIIKQPLWNYRNWYPEINGYISKNINSTEINIFININIRNILPIIIFAAISLLCLFIFLYNIITIKKFYFGLLFPFIILLIIYLNTIIYFNYHVHKIKTFFNRILK
jgi:hypothetical protein